MRGFAHLRLQGGPGGSGTELLAHGRPGGDGSGVSESGHGDLISCEEERTVIKGPAPPAAHMYQRATRGGRPRSTVTRTLLARTCPAPVRTGHCRRRGKARSARNRSRDGTGGEIAPLTPVASPRDPDPQQRYLLAPPAGWAPHARGGRSRRRASRRPCDPRPGSKVRYRQTGVASRGRPAPAPGRPSAGGGLPGSGGAPGEIGRERWAARQADRARSPRGRADGGRQVRAAELPDRPWVGALAPRASGGPAAAGHDMPAARRLASRHSPSRRQGAAP